MSENIKNIVVIGGGISGLATLHYLKKKFKDEAAVTITLLEKNERLGGTIHSMEREGCCFETGPNGFLNNKPRTLELIEEINLTDRLVRATDNVKERYIQRNDLLYQLPTSPKDFFQFELLNIFQKLRVLCECFIPRGGNEEETIEAFANRRFGKSFTKYVVDPFVSGIFAGNINELNLSKSFPKIYEMEQEYGSLIKAMKARRRNKRNVSGQANETDQANELNTSVKGELHSFYSGMGEIIEALELKYQDVIRRDHTVQTIAKKNKEYTIYTDKNTITADHIFLCAPAYSSAYIVKNQFPELTALLEKIEYASVSVVGLSYWSEILGVEPRGFGYLIPSSENKKVLGVLFESNVFPDRCPKEQHMMRVMIGGARHSDVTQWSFKDLADLAKDTIKDMFQAVGDPKEVFVKTWQKGIPQYTTQYFRVVKAIDNFLQHEPQLHVVSNYWKGVSMNDCIENAYQEVQRLSLEK